MKLSSINIIIKKYTKSKSNNLATTREHVNNDVDQIKDVKEQRKCVSITHNEKYKHHKMMGTPISLQLLGSSCLTVIKVILLPLLGSNSCGLKGS